MSEKYLKNRYKRKLVFKTSVTRRYADNDPTFFKHFISDRI